jgi:iron complex transport system ATP-binding protein
MRLGRPARREPALPVSRPAGQEATQGQTIVSISGLSFSYDGARTPALDDLTLNLSPGVITAILGPNGSGKTTLLRVLLGVLPPGSGSVWLDGQPEHTYSRRRRSQLMGLVPQEEHIPFDFSVLEYVLLGRAPYLSPLAMPGRGDREIALDALNTAGLAHLQDRPLPTLSGGERQLAVVARALAQQPRILLMDEPTAHLDLSNQGRILSIMRELAALGVTLIMTTHDPNLASSIAGFAVLMRQGKILEAGPAEDMLTDSRLSSTYGVPVQVFDVDDRRIILLP